MLSHINKGQGLVPILSARSECVATSLTRGRWQGNPKTLGASGSQVKGQGQGKPPPQGQGQPHTMITRSRSRSKPT